MPRNTPPLALAPSQPNTSYRTLLFCGPCHAASTQHPPDQRPSQLVPMPLTAALQMKNLVDVLKLILALFQTLNRPSTICDKCTRSRAQAVRASLSRLGKCNESAMFQLLARRIRGRVLCADPIVEAMARRPWNQVPPCITVQC